MAGNIDKEQTIQRIEGLLQPLMSCKIGKEHRGIYNEFLNNTEI
jgi:hypothetical protein